MVKYSPTQIKQIAEKQKKRIDEEFGSAAYGGSNFTPVKTSVRGAANVDRAGLGAASKERRETRLEEIKAITSPAPATPSRYPTRTDVGIEERLDNQVETAKENLRSAKERVANRRSMSAAGALGNNISTKSELTTAKNELEEAESQRYYYNQNKNIAAIEKEIKSTPEYIAALAAQDKAASRNGGIGGRNVAAGSNSQRRLDARTDEQQAILSTLEMLDDERANEYRDYLTQIGNAKIAADDAQMLEEHEWMRFPAFLAGSFTSGGSLLGSTANAIKRGITGEYTPVDINSDIYQGARVQTEAREQMVGGIDNGFARFLADTGLSMASFASKIPLGPLALPAMGMESAGLTAYDSLRRGASPDTAAANGIAAGAMEMLAEKLPLDNLLKLANRGNVAVFSADGIKQIGKQSGIEMTEEMATSYAQTLADISLMGDNSVWQQTYDNYITQGLTEAEATRKTNIDLFVKDPVLSALGGGLSGGAFGAGATILGQRNATSTPELSEEAEAIIENKANVDFYADQFGNVSDYLTAGLLPEHLETDPPENTKDVILRGKDVPESMDRAEDAMETGAAANIDPTIALEQLLSTIYDPEAEEGYTNSIPIQEGDNSPSPILSSASQRVDLGDVVKGVDADLRTPEGDGPEVLTQANSARRAAETGAITAELADTLSSRKHRSLSWDATTNLADTVLAEYGTDPVYQHLLSAVTGKNSRQLNSVETAAAEILVQDYLRNGETEKALEIATAVQDSTTEAARVLNIMKMIQKELPGGYVAVANRGLVRKGLPPLTNEEVTTLNNLQELAREIETIWAIKDPKQQADMLAKFTDNIDPWYAKKINNLVDKASSADNLESTIGLLADYLVANKQPHTAVEKFRAWQRVNLLLNPKTNVRNTAGNLLFTGAETIGNTFFSPLVDKALGKATGKRTATTPQIKAGLEGTKEAVSGVNDAFRAGVISQLSNRYTDNKSSGRNFDNPVLNALDSLTSLTLAMGDKIFYGFRKGDTKAQLLKLNPDMNEQEADQIATTLGEEATFQDDSVMSKALLQLQNLGSDRADTVLGKTANIIKYTVLPFAKTPANLLQRTLEYTPLGLLVNAIPKAVKLVKSGTETTFAEQRKTVDAITRGISGSGLMGLGILLGSLGKASGEDAEEEAFRKANGILDNAWKFTIDGEEYWLDLSSLGPIPAAINLGASIFNELDGDGVDEATALNIVGTLMSAPINDIAGDSLWEGVVDLVGNVGEQDIQAAMEEILGDAATQLVPLGSFLRAVTNIIDPYSRETSADTEIGWVWNRIKNQIPGLSFTLPERYTTTGEQQTRSAQGFEIFPRITNSLFSPGSVSKSMENDPVITELNRLYEQSNNSGVYLDTAPYSFTVAGEKYPVTGENRSNYQRTLGENAYNAIEELLASPDYEKLPNETKEAVIELIAKYATGAARNEYSDNTGQYLFDEQTENSVLYDYVSDAESGGVTPATALLAKKIVGEENSNAGKLGQLLGISGLGDTELEFLARELFASRSDTFVDNFATAVDMGIEREFADAYEYYTNDSGKGKANRVRAYIDTLPVSDRQKTWLKEAIV